MSRRYVGPRWRGMNPVGMSNLVDPARAGSYMLR